MATLDLQVSGSGNDAYERGDGTFISNSIWLNVYPIADADTSSAFYRCAGIRFTNVTIPHEATIGVAYLELRNRLANGAAFDIYGQAADDSPSFLTNPNIINAGQRPRTNASVSWEEDFTAAQYEQSPSIVSIVQEIIDRPGWASGNSMTFLLIAKTNYAGDIGDFQEEFGAADQGASVAAKLHIEYTEPGPDDGAETKRRLFTFRTFRVYGLG